ncbi:hypothetical protein [Neolewinella agarilytica]|uniref:hypothetical protein n=1 Tax=Neolewinella agarilytica TaxID=478744 RepID=UPI0023534593|nr:hypothetical protein [Neolewinella agarilytica]
MKIHNEADRQALDQRIQTELGVDIGKYRDPEVTERLSELIVFPLYVLSWTIRPVLLAFVLYLLGFFLLDLVHVQYLIYAVLGLILALITGLFAGLFYLTIRFRSDIRAIMTYSMDILKGIVQDMDALNTSTHAGNRKDVLQLLFLGTMHLITIPLTSDIIGNKVPFIGGLVARLVRRVLTVMTNLFRFDKINLEEAKIEAGGEGKILPMYLASVTGFHGIMDKVLKVGIRVIQAPIGLLLGFFGVLSYLFIYLIN